MLVRGSGTKAPVRKFASGCVQIRVSRSSRLSGRLVHMEVKNFGRRNATLGNILI